MFYRLLFCVSLIFICTSCKNSLVTEDDSKAPLDTIIDFTKVDVSPSFKICKKLLDKAKTDCFRVNIQKYFIKKLKKLSLTAENHINETVYVVLKVDENGKGSLKKLILTDEIASHFPEMNISIEKMITDLPKLSPALKRGIPVTTEYKLPIHIVVE